MRFVTLRIVSSEFFVHIHDVSTSYDFATSTRLDFSHFFLSTTWTLHNSSLFSCICAPLGWMYVCVWARMRIKGSHMDAAAAIVCVCHRRKDGNSECIERTQLQLHEHTDSPTKIINIGSVCCDACKLLSNARVFHIYFKYAHRRRCALNWFISPCWTSSLPLSSPSPRPPPPMMIFERTNEKSKIDHTKYIQHAVRFTSIYGPRS